MAGGAGPPGARAGARGADRCAHGRAAAERGAGVGPVRPGRVAGSASESKSVTVCLRGVGGVGAPERLDRGGMEPSGGSVSLTCAPSAERTDTGDVNFLSLTKSEMSVTAGGGSGCRLEVPLNVGQKLPGRGFGIPLVSHWSRVLAVNAVAFLAAWRVSPQNPHLGLGTGWGHVEAHPHIHGCWSVAERSGVV